MPKRWVVGGIWALLMWAGVWACVLRAGAEQPTKPVRIAIPSTAVRDGQPGKPGKLIISDVIITGNQRMGTEQIKVRLRSKPGDKYKPYIVNDDVRELYKTGQFSNITTYLNPNGTDHVKLYFAVREMPNMVQMVRKVTFLGAKHIKHDELQNITGVRPGMPLNPNLNRRGCQWIMEKYAEMGRSFADCQLLKGGDPADTEVVYQITEGPKVKVRDIQFTGNSFAAAELLRQMVAVRVGGTYNRETAEKGMETMYTFYRELGFQDVRIALEIRTESAGETSLIYHIHEESRSRRADKSPE